MGSGELPAVERRWLERVVRATIKIEAVIEVRPDQDSISSSPSVLSNAEIADRLASLAQLLSSQNENPYKIKAYQRAAARIRNLSESLYEMVRDQEDLTRFAGIGEAIASAIREIVTTGTLGKLERLRAQVTPAVASITSHPRLDPKRVIRVYKKLGISSVNELRQRLESGEVEKLFGTRMAQHIRQGLTETHAMLLYRADDLSAAIEAFLLGPCAVNRAEAAGDFRSPGRCSRGTCFRYRDRRLSRCRCPHAAVWRPYSQ